jgi:hypothetical protein
MKLRTEQQKYSQAMTKFINILIQNKFIQKLVIHHQSKLFRFLN